MHSLNATPRRFLVLTTQRTGSSWLMDRINSVPGAQAHMELFYHEPRREPPRAGCNDYPRFVETASHGRRRSMAVFEYLDTLYSRPGAVGFKLMYSQLRQYPEILPYIAWRRLVLVHLVRNNHLDTFLSEHLAKETGRFHATREERYEQNATVSLNPASVADCVRNLARKQRIMRAVLNVLPNHVHEISYEALCHTNSTFLELCSFIGIPGEREDREKSHLVKTQRAPHSAVIANYQEVRSALTLAGYQHLLQ